MSFTSEESAGLRGHLVKGVSGTFALKVISRALSLAIAIFLARLLGAAGYGAYGYAIAWIGLLAILGTLGLDRLLVRETAVCRIRADWGRMRGLLRAADGCAGALATVLAVVGALILWLAPRFLEAHMAAALAIALAALPFLVLTTLRQSAMRGLQRIVPAQIPVMLVQPVLFLLLAAMAWRVAQEEFNALWAVGLYVVASVIAFLLASFLLARYLPARARTAAPRYEIRSWMHSALPLLFVSSMMIVNQRADIIMLGTLRGAELAGIYAVAVRGAELVAFVLQSVNTAVAPSVASIYSSGDLERLQRLVTRTARVVLFLSLPIGLAVMVFAYWFLYLFGPEFTPGRAALIILSAGQLFNAAMGSVGMLLTMTGFEREAGKSAMTGACINILLNALLIPRFGLEGAAVATVSSVVVWNVLMGYFVYRRLGIFATAAGPLPWVGRRT